MKTIVKTVLIAALSTSTAAAFADGCTTTGYHQGDTTFFGKTQCQKVVLPSLTVNGHLNIDRVKVNGDSTINGIVEGYDLWLKGALTIHGKTDLNKVMVGGATTISGETTLSSVALHSLTVNGKLNATGGKFTDVTVNGAVNLRDVTIKNGLTASTTMAVLNGVDVQNIKITRSISKKPQIVCLEKASHVQGDITFEAGNGKVYTIGASKIMGKVNGGTVIQGQCPGQGEVTIQ